ncbi:MAG: hypothetical protein OXG25_05750 [Gammaproteobacteria bacterium]|nr:hypothetical protein [Gammaproteobacteria bacterium]
MTYFLFAGDMLVMLFMVAVATWVFVWSPDRDIEETAEIPLNDEEPDKKPNAI